ncbi:glycoside hydrolase family 130 protein [Novosphingobium capsulatum]|uniref:glycoside hydrolase family 130 protein n=1 Tax=Novosphingobium capsulatum TaxID=13688 RepID=UPI001FDF56BF|nr:glycoside hydrolase family 130 protein [Novosphingobium capsulatum]WQD91298.1 glycoside hydrolase family 130 protein [Novosphingobium capsulatum]
MARADKKDAVMPPADRPNDSLSDEDALRARVDAAVLPPPIVGFWQRAHVQLKPDATRTVLRPFDLAYPEGFGEEPGDRVRAIVDRIAGLDDDAVTQALAYMKELLDARHRDVLATLERRVGEITAIAPQTAQLGIGQRLLVGGMFLQEYAFEAAALFNPTIVPAPDQSDAPPGGMRFICALRGIGEGHVSSITFRTGCWDGAAGVTIDPPAPLAASPRIDAQDEDGTALRLHFDSAQDVSEAVLFPMTAAQARGLEDLRLVQFRQDDGTACYHGTFTAFDGVTGRTQMLSTSDFRRFDIRTLTGRVALNKGMALFPRQVGGRYAMIGRQDNENIWLMRSDSLWHWDEAERIVCPRHVWEFVQMGNCGPPIEIDEGWLLMTHGVGPVRNYTIGAVLLDRDDPSRVLGRARLPLLRPGPEQRDGYVPNVVYSCGSLVLGRRLLVPYGIADNFASFVSCDLDPLLVEMD